jgi:hypothetical protein
MKKNKILISGLIAMLILGIIIVGGCISQKESTVETPPVQPAETTENPEVQKCPDSCDDKDDCTKDYCSVYTEYECRHDSTSPCCGNGACEPSESYESCPKDCEKPAEEIAVTETKESEKPPPEISETKTGSIKISAFDISDFSDKKTKNDNVINVMVKIAHEFDIIFIQGVNDPSKKAVSYLEDKINSGGHNYKSVCSIPLGRSNTMEQYCYFWNNDNVKLKSEHVYNDVGGVFEREPYIVSFGSGNFDFTLIGIKTKQNDARSEIANLKNVVISVLSENPGEKDVIVLGNLNADGRYFNENDRISPLASQEFNWAVTNDMNTMINENLTYDRIIMMDSTFRQEYVAGSAGVFFFDKKYGVTDKRVIDEISRHYPVYAEFKTGMQDDD